MKHDGSYTARKIYSSYQKPLETRKKLAVFEINIQYMKWYFCLKKIHRFSAVAHKNKTKNVPFTLVQTAVCFKKDAMTRLNLTTFKASFMWVSVKVCIESWDNWCYSAEVYFLLLHTYFHSHGLWKYDFRY